MDVFRLRPTIEAKNARNPNPFLDEFPEDRVRRHNFAKVPILLTTTPDEGIFTFSARMKSNHFIWPWPGLIVKLCLCLISAIIRNKDLLQNLNDEFERVAPITFGYEFDQKLKHRKVEVSKAIRKFYFDDKPITPEMEQNLTNAYTDAYFLTGTRRAALMLGMQTPVYVGLFTHDRKDFSPVRAFGVAEDVAGSVKRFNWSVIEISFQFVLTFKGVSHCEDLSYVFNPTGTGTSSILTYLGELTEEKDIEFSKKFVKMLASFVETG